MHTLHPARTARAVLAGAAMLSLAACGSTTNNPSDTDPSATTSGSSAPTSSVNEAAPVTISVGNTPSQENPEAYEQHHKQVEKFEALYPHITVESVEGNWSPEWFLTGLAGGTLPTVFYLPFTEAQTVMANEQVLDITDYLGDFEALSKINPTVLDNVTNEEGRVWAVPHSAYTMALVYNRDLFQQAGLDPDQPPGTWDEVRDAAKTIEENTGAQGFQAWTAENSGGWALTTMAYAFGGSLLSEDGNTSTINNPATAKALEYYRTLRWEDDTFGDNFLLGWADGYTHFASGQVGMWVSPADGYRQSVVNLGMDPQHFGAGPLPQEDGSLGILGGGSLRVINRDATPEEARAGLQWIEYYHMSVYVDEQTAVDRAQADNEAGDAVGNLAFPVVDQELEAQYLSWVEDYINVPRENFEAYLATAENQPMAPEPARLAQDAYAELDTVVQAVLTDPDADIDALLTTAQNNVQSKLDAN